MYSFIPEGYKSTLSVYDTQKAISLLKRIFIDRLAGELNLYRVSAPLFVQAGTGVNDDLNGVERPVAFDIANTDVTGQVVHSLAKWKRMALKRYDFFPGKGLYTDMNAIRRDEEMDNLHSVYVDQWDWEKVIEEKDRNVDFLKSQVDKIVAALCDTQMTMQSIYPALALGGQINRQVTYITAQELEDRYPDLTPKQREDEVTKKYGTVFLIGIGGKLRSGKPHGGLDDAGADDELDVDLVAAEDDAAARLGLLRDNLALGRVGVDRHGDVEAEGLRIGLAVDDVFALFPDKIGHGDALGIDEHGLHSVVYRAEPAPAHPEREL